MITNCIAFSKNPVLVQFKEYVLSFYNPTDGIYPIPGLTGDDVVVAIVEYLKLCCDDLCSYEWGDGDSIDRERVRYILENNA